MARLVLMGSPSFALPTFEALAEEHEIAAVFTQPDKPAGRGMRPTPSPVKRWAEAHGFPVLQPRSLRRDPEAVARLRELRPEVIVVVAYGLILPSEVLRLPPYGCLNLHASLLPRYRGPAPIQAAILNGDLETGVTVMLMTEEVDAGPILAMEREPIAPEDTAETLGGRLAQRGARLMRETLRRWLAGEITPQPQDPSQATYCPRITKADGEIDWRRPAAEIERRIRAFTPWPGSYTFWKGRLLKIGRARVRPDLQAPPGQVVAVDRGAAVGTGEGALMLLEVQLEGKRMMPIEAFLNGHPDFLGATLGQEG
ncbi:methionyl-tRNA formyltransferase [Thermoflexus sp.]|uniref:methionyl-tRNA formyltransferase n=1 Tax=Thermoflexus sp. TaxID=1969742 RepID=UPI0035E42AC4